MDVEELSVLTFVGRKNDSLDLCSAYIDFQLGIITTTQLSFQVLSSVSIENIKQAQKVLTPGDTSRKVKPLSA